MRKIGYILATIVALSLASCDEVPMPSGTQGYLTVATTSLQLDHTKGYFFVEVDSDIEWNISCSAEWVELGDTEFSGAANAIVNYSANEHDKSRSAIVKVEPKVEGAANSAEVLITQRGKNSGGNYDDNGDIGGDDGSGDDSGNDGGSGGEGGDDSDFAGSGDGTATSPYDVIRALDIINQLAYDDTSVYTRGVISEIEQIDLSKGNAKYYISNNGATYNSQLYVYRGNYLDNEKFTSSNQISVGDEVVICGPLLLYQSTKPEINTPNYIVSIVKANGGDDSGDDGNDDSGSGGEGGNTGGGANGTTKYSGWAELPTEVDNSDYYYAYHMIPDKGNGQVRNFAVCYSKELGCPVWVASPMHSYYTAKNTSRSDAYGPDPKIPASIQVHKREGYTRGHMLGSSDRLVSVGANKQAFYYTNIAPQLSTGFNTGGGVWNNLESYCDGQLCADTLYMVNGCYWENYNKKSSGTVIPTHYYKVLLRTKKGNSGKWVVNCSASELKCVVFMVEHNSNQHKVEPHRGMMMSVAELEEMTGHTFFSNVPNAPKDTFNPSDWGM